MDEICVGDLVRLRKDGTVARVAAILLPGTSAAADYYVDETGGIILEYPGGAIEVWCFQPWWRPEEEFERVPSDLDSRSRRSSQ